MPALLACLALAGCPSPSAEGPPPDAAPEAPASARPAAGAETPRSRLGLWVPCEGALRVLESPARIEALVEGARALGASDLFVQVYRGGRAWFDSSQADPTPWQALVAGGRPDPLRLLLERAHAHGLRVHAWANVLSLNRHRDGPVARRLGPGAVQTDRRGRSLLDYPGFEVPADERRWARMGTPALWLDPGAPGVADTVAGILGELTARYPELDGLHLDYIRYPDVLPFVPGARFPVGIDFGYGEASRVRFRAETGLEAPFGSSTRNAAAFDAWRRARVTEVVRRIGEAARAARPGLVVSAAVWAYPGRTYLSIHQDWTRWQREGLVDFAVPMAYSRDPDLFTLLARTNAAAGGPRTWLGLGSWLFAGDPGGAVSQLREARALPVAGVALFSWDALAAAPALLEALAEAAGRGGPSGPDTGRRAADAGGTRHGD